MKMNVGYEKLGVGPVVTNPLKRFGKNRLNLGGSIYTDPSVPINPFNDNNRGPSGVMLQHRGRFSFLRSDPYMEPLTGGSIPDFNKYPYHQSWDKGFANKIAQVRDNVELNRRQIRYNALSGTGTSVPTKQTFDYSTNYHDMVRPNSSRKWFTYIAVGAFVYFVFLR